MAKSPDYFTINWDRAIYLSGSIDDDLVTRLTPEILRLRHGNDAPITVGIDSVGGSVASMDAIRGLLEGPDQDGNTGRVIGVVTNAAFSAAASFLAFCDYSIALPHSEILFHDVRYGGIRDVTPDKAKTAAQQLQSANEKSSSSARSACAYTRSVSAESAWPSGRSRTKKSPHT